MKKKNTKLKVRNFVQMHVMEFNRPTVFKDKKKELKKFSSSYLEFILNNDLDYILKSSPR